MPNDQRLTDEQILAISKDLDLKASAYEPDQISNTLRLARAIEQAATRAAVEQAAQLCKERSDRASTIGRALEAIDCGTGIRNLAKGE
jgi:hypothetical protein